MYQTEKNSTTVKIISTLCIIIFPLGMLGVHDFVMGRKKYGYTHLAMVLLPVCLLLLMMLNVKCGASDGCPKGLGIALTLGPIICGSTIASYVWAIVEYVMILRNRIVSTSNPTRESKKRTL